MLGAQVLPIAALHGEPHTVNLRGAPTAMKGSLWSTWEDRSVHLQLPGKAFQNILHMAGLMCDPI